MSNHQSLYFPSPKDRAEIEDDTEQILRSARALGGFICAIIMQDQSGEPNKLIGPLPEIDGLPSLKLLPRSCIKYSTT